MKESALARIKEPDRLVNSLNIREWPERHRLEEFKERQKRVKVLEEMVARGQPITYDFIAL